MSDRLTQLLKLHQLDPADPFCTYGIALEHAKTGATETALDWLDKTLALDALYCYAYYQKAKMLNQLGKREDAKAAVKAGLEAARKSKAPEAAKAQSELASLLETLG